MTESMVLERIEPFDGEVDHCLAKLMILPGAEAELKELQVVDLHLKCLQYISGQYEKIEHMDDQLFLALRLSHIWQGQWLKLEFDIRDDQRLTDPEVQSALLDSFIRRNPKLRLTREKAMTTAMDLIQHRNFLRTQIKPEVFEALGNCRLTLPNYEYLRDGIDHFMKARRGGGLVFLDDAMAEFEAINDFSLVHMEHSEVNMLNVVANAVNMDLGTEQLAARFTPRLGCILLHHALDQLDENRDAPLEVTQKLTNAINAELDEFCVATLNHHADLNRLKFVIVSGPRTGKVRATADLHTSGNVPLALCPVKTRQLGSDQ